MVICNIDLNRLIDKARALNATQLHMAAGKRPSLRLISGILELEDEEVAHIQDIKSLVASLLSSEQRDLLENEGDILFSLMATPAVSCGIVKSVGSYSVIFKLQVDEKE